ncbi:NAD(P)-dependent dehydrogenase, short-chain alcohol dehydrogenase family [Halogranum rubrum]|uniref:NAD(P)-dependent dehydrogenase, short-chain alcohol dehydrogenase family n=1 Tax=Halogranum rubrum TaxID=553466 RepID=A0A1I4GX88_9EURY|nr:SDR family oxidoreductase [Halogranum rubrum]SFL34150.1 NAD(P)-dependent dehydrogenase, short-chain alcohol dehydrogenase family [Halogranum rubrum]
MGTASYSFTDETVIVTGGSSGIGRAVARRFGEAGANVVVADIRETPKGEGESDEQLPTHLRIRRAGGTASFVQTDVSDPDELTAVVEAAREFGGVDVMVNNAGAYRGAPLLDTDAETLDALYGINVRSVLVGTRAAARDMLERDATGTILNTASISSQLAQPNHAAYDATKGAVMMLTRVAALELAQRGIRVNAVAPGTIDTRISDGDGGDSSLSGAAVDLGKDIPMGRQGDPEELAGSYLYLASDDASYVTGHLLYVDGGYTIL